MSESTNAILFYGYCWAEEASHPWRIGHEDDEEIDEDKDDWETRYAAAQGCTAPTETYPERMGPDGHSTPKNYTAAEQAIIKQHHAYWKKKDKIAKTSPCEVGTHCSGECPMPYIAVKVSLKLARRGYPEEISSIAVDPAWNDQLADFCRKIGLKIGAKRRTAWWLVSNWL